MIQRSELLQNPVTAGYIPQAATGMVNFARNRPVFNSTVIREMTADPRVLFGLWLIKGPIITNSRFKVVTEDEEVKEFLIENITRFWRNSAVRALKAIEWGFSGSETIYRLRDGKIHFDTLKDIHSLDVRPVTFQGGIIGMKVNNVGGHSKSTYIGIPKAFYHVHWRERHPYFGLSRLFGAHVPWWEQWSDGGYRDIRRLWFYKNAYEGGTIYHPPGITRTKEGIVISNKDLAREIIEKRRTGGTLTLPNSLSGDAGTRQWEYIPPTPNTIPGGLLEYGGDLRRELFEAMGIPPEVVDGGTGGMGAATGRQVPEEAFFSILQEINMWLMQDADAQIFRFLVSLNFGAERASSYDIVPFGLTAKAEEREDRMKEDELRQQANQAAIQAGGGANGGQVPGQAFRQ